MTRLTPVWPNLPEPATFLPFVGLIVALVPAMMAWYFGHLTAGQAAWGLRGIDVLDGDLFLLHHQDGSAPPVFPWCLGATLAIDLGAPIGRLVVPSYLFWLLSAVVIYRLVERWHDPTTALLTLAALAINPVVIGQTQHGRVGLVALFWVSLALWAYVEHMRSEADVWSWWTAIAGLAIGLCVLTLGISAIWVPVLIALHLAYDQIQSARGWSEGFRRLWTMKTLRAGGVALLIAGVLATPWFLIARGSEGPTALFSTIGFVRDKAGFEAPALVMPTTLALGLFGVARALRQRIRRQADRQASLPVLWSLVAYLSFLLIEPTTTGLLFVVVPLTVLAMRSLQLVVNRRLRDQTSFVLVVATLAVAVFGSNPGLLDNVLAVLKRWVGIAQTLPENVEPDLGWQLFSVHLGLDVVIGGAALLAWLYRHSGRQDSYRRWYFGVFAILVMGLGAVTGLSTSINEPRTTDPAMALYREIVRFKEENFVAFVGEKSPSSTLAFVTRSATMGRPVHSVRDLVELDALLDRQQGKPLVVISDPFQPLPDSLPVTQSGVPMTLGRRYRSDLAAIYTVRTKNDDATSR